MNPERRLADIVAALQSAGIRCLVMGGHAVRYYGLNRNTNDFDLHLAPDSWDDLTTRLAVAKLNVAGTLQEGDSWRPGDFRRFRIGALPEGQDEWLEFWRANHLLSPFVELHERREEGTYGGAVLPFLSLPDLIASKETERDKDWDDIAVLEEFHDARLLHKAASGVITTEAALAEVRCRRGLEAFLREGYPNAEVVQASLHRTSRSVTQSLLLPLAPTSDLRPSDVPIEPVVINRLRTTTPATPLHYALVEIVRRRFRHVRQAADLADKQAIRAAQNDSQ